MARYWDLMALSDNQPANVIGEKGVLYDKPGFEVDFISRILFQTKGTLLKDMKY